MQIVRLVFDFGSASRFGLRCGFGGDSFFAAPRQLGFSFGFSAFFCCHEIAGFAPEDLPWFEFLRIRAYDGIHWVWLHCWELPSLRKVSPASCVMMMSNVDIAQWFVWDSCNWGGPLSLHCAFRVNFCFVKKCLIISSIGGSADWIMDISADHGVLAALFGYVSFHQLNRCVDIPADFVFVLVAMCCSKCGLILVIGGWRQCLVKLVIIECWKSTRKIHYEVISNGSALLDFVHFCSFRIRSWKSEQRFGGNGWYLERRWSRSSISWNLTVDFFLKCFYVQ